MSKEFISVRIGETKEAGFEEAKLKLYNFCDKTTVLFLSGGSTPRPLYEQLAKEGILSVGAVGMVDERAGEPYHRDSNEKMIKDTGFLAFLEKTKTPFHSMLKSGLNQKKLAENYDKTVRTLLFNFNKSIAVLGIGSDGHTSGIAPNRPDFVNPLFSPLHKSRFVSEFEDPKSMAEGGFGQRITMTFTALEQIGQLIILAFGDNKKEALRKMFEKGPVEEIPARFFLLPNIAKKTILITDQSV